MKVLMTDTIALIVLVQVLNDLTHTIRWEILWVHGEYPALVHIICTTVQVGYHKHFSVMP